MNLNFRKKYRAYIALLLVMIFINPLWANAFPQVIDEPLPGDRGEMCQHPVSPYSLWHNPKIVEDLKLTEDQLSKIKEADFNYREKSQDLEAELRMLTLQMEKAFSMIPVDESTISELAKKIADIKGKIFILNIESRLEIEKILTVEQIKTFRAVSGPPLYGKRDTPHPGIPPRDACPRPN